MAVARPLPRIGIFNSMSCIVLVKTKKNYFVCGECTVSFRSEVGLTRHMNIHKMPKPGLPKCEMCKKVFVSQINLEHHQQDYDGPRICRLCKMSFASKYSLEQHFATCKTKLICPVCKYRCLSQDSLDEYVLRNHENWEKFPCTNCKDVFYSQNALLAHTSEHHQNLFTT